MSRFYLYNLLTCLLTSLIFALCAFIATGAFWAIVSFVIGILVNIIVFKKANNILEQFFAVQVVSPQSAKELYLVLNTLAEEARISLPIICISKTSLQPNIYALTSKSGNKIIISPTITKVLKESELQAMLAYQVARISSGAARHHAYLTCMASLPSFFLHLGVIFPAFGGIPTKRIPYWLVALSFPFTWLATIICFIGNHRRHIFTVDILTLNIGGNTSGFFHGLSKLDTACSRLPDYKISLFPAFSILYNVMPIPAKNKISALQYSVEKRAQKIQAEITDITKQSGKNQKSKSNRTSAPKKNIPPAKIKRLGITDGPTRSSS